MTDIRKMIKDGSHILILVGLLVLLYFILVFTGIAKCSSVPFGCELYWGVMGYATGGPRVLIVYGDSGLGNPIGGCTDEYCSLQDMLANPEFLGVRADTLHIDRVNTGNLRPYHLVIVERARKISTEKLRAFIDYYGTGGRLVWTGDAGTELGQSIVNGQIVTDEYLYLNERQDDTNEHIKLGPWARKQGDLMISFDQLLSLTYRGNFCDISPCKNDKPVYAGSLQPEPSLEHPLIRGMSVELPLWVFDKEDFAIVNTLSGGITTEVLSLDFGTKIVTGTSLDTPPGLRDANFSRSTPMIVTSGVGERVIYYAMPPELYANPKLEGFDKGVYLLPLENMYYGIIKG